MRREISWSDDALSETENARSGLESQKPGHGREFLEIIDIAVSTLEDFPQHGTPVETVLTYPVRRVRVRAFGFWLYYTNYPSVDFNTGEALDVIHFLACRHEKQSDPNWPSRDPFRLP